MTQRSDIERALDLWLADGPNHVPDRVFDDAVVALYRAPQRSHWRLRWRNLAVSTKLLAAATIAALAIAGIGVALTAFSPAPDLNASPTPVPSGSPDAVESPALPPISCLVDGTPPEPCLGRLTSGTTYRLGSPLVPFTFTAMRGWQNPMNIVGGAMLERQGDTSGAAIYVWPDPVVASQVTCTKAPDPNYGRRVDDIVAFLVSHPGLEVTQRRAVEVGGLTGQEMHVARAEGNTEPCVGRASLFVHADTITDGFWWDLSRGSLMHIWLLEAGDGHTVIVNVQAPEDAFYEFLGAARTIVANFRFERQAECIDGTACLGTLTPGSYSTSQLGTPFRFTVPAGWKNIFDARHGYVLQPADEPDPRNGRGIYVFRDVVAANQSACTVTVDPSIWESPEPGYPGAPAPDALIRWLQTLPTVSMTAPTHVSVDGFDAVTYDISADAASTRCDGEAKLFVSVEDYSDRTTVPTFWWGVAPGRPERHLVFRHGWDGGIVVVIVAANEDEFEAFTATTASIIDSFDWQ